MMIRQTIFILSLVCLTYVHVVGQTTYLEGTKWGNKMSTGCIQTYFLKGGGEFEYFNCEMNVIRTGNYTLNQDTLKVLVYHVDETPAIAGGTGMLNLRFQYNFLLTEGNLKMIFFKDFKFPREMDTTAKGIVFEPIIN